MRAGMSTNHSDENSGAAAGANHLLMRAVADGARAERRLVAAIDDFFTPENARLDDWMRMRLATMLSGVVAAIEHALRRHAARLLAGDGYAALATQLGDEGPQVEKLLADAGLLRDAGLMRELLARARHDDLAQSLSAHPNGSIDTPNLLARMAEQADSIIAGAAAQLMVAESTRRSGHEPGGTPRSDLPAEMHHRLVWQAAAALRMAFLPPSAGPAAALDRALSEAALRCLAAHDEGERAEAAAMRLAVAIDATPAELPDLLVEALNDRLINLFCALLAHAAGLGYDDAREAVLDPVADRLWLVLRALELDRATIARIGLVLCEAQPRRDIELFAEEIDTIAAIDGAAALAALAMLRLHPAFREAVMALSGARAA